MNTSRGAVRFSIVLLLLLLLLTISCEEKSEEVRIREVVEKAGGLIQAKNLDGLMDLLTEDYADADGRNKESLRRLVEDYFVHSQGIVVHLLSTRVERIELPEAVLTVEASISSGAAKFLRKLVKISADYYRLDLRLVKDPEGWRVQSGVWDSVTLDELSAESIDSLKRIFPGIF
jgi:hypothetical protein